MVRMLIVLILLASPALAVEFDSDSDGKFDDVYKIDEGNLATGHGIQLQPSEGAFEDGDKTALDSIVSRLELTTDTVMTESQLLGSKFITNQGASGEADITLPAVSYGISRIILSEEAQVIEVNPPSGEAFDLDGTTLDADDVVDSDATVGSKIVATRMKNGAGTWIWSLDSVRGLWSDSGATD